MGYRSTKSNKDCNLFGCLCSFCYLCSIPAFVALIFVNLASVNLSDNTQVWISFTGLHTKSWVFGSENTLCYIGRPSLELYNIVVADQLRSNFSEGICQSRGTELYLKAEGEDDATGNTTEKGPKTRCYIAGQQLLTFEDKIPLGVIKSCVVKGNKIIFSSRFYRSGMKTDDGKTRCSFKDEGLYYTSERREEVMNKDKDTRCYTEPGYAPLAIVLVVCLLRVFFVYPCAQGGSDFNYTDRTCYIYIILVVLGPVALEVAGLTMYILYRTQFLPNLGFQSRDVTATYYFGLTINTLSFIICTAIYVLHVLRWFLQRRNLLRKRPSNGKARAIAKKPPVAKPVVDDEVHVWQLPPKTPEESRRLREPDDEAAENNNIELLPILDNHEEDVKQLALSLWNPGLVGVGRDARGLRHTDIDILEVKKLDCTLPSSYINRKSELVNYAARLGGNIQPVDKLKLFGDPISTMQQLKANRSSLIDTVNTNINEVYLFHGTPARNVVSIEQTGFSVERCRSFFLGRGIYFAESMNKADQYTGRAGGDCTVILARVLLGKTILLRDKSLMTTATAPPCPSCCAVGCTKQHIPTSRKFDSVAFHPQTGLFREFVIYQNGLAVPEYVIKYRRI